MTVPGVDTAQNSPQKSLKASMANGFKKLLSRYGSNFNSNR